ncbi:MAG: YkgJ family cysteine cluster protein [Polyangiaceae bacterium]
MSAESRPQRVVLKADVDADAIDDAARFAGWRLTNIIPGDARHPRQLLFSVFDGGWLYLVDDARFAQRWFQAEGPRQTENLQQVRTLLACEAPDTEPAPAAHHSLAEPSSSPPDGTSDPVDDPLRPPLPHRPRLADHVLPRMHVMNGGAHLLLHDNARGDALELELEQFEWLELADGTRDEEGLYLEASRRGVLHRRSELRALLRQLHERGELAGGIAGEQRIPRVPEREIKLLPGLELGCDSNGSCCRTYSSMLFEEGEVKATEGITPPGLKPLHRRVFLPAFGADAAVQAVATLDGACVFLGADSRCVLHARGAKPRGCNDYPLTLVDDGETLWAVPVFECPCVELSFLREITTAPPGLPATEAGLPEERPVIRLREHFELDTDVSIDQAALREWVKRGIEQIPEAIDAVDALHWLWSWSHANVNETLASVRTPPSYALAPWVQRLFDYAERRLESAAWRSEQDRTRRLVRWMYEASSTLLDPARVSELLEQRQLDTTASRRQHAAEWAYVRCQLGGYQFAQGRETLRSALEQRCARLLLARAMGGTCPIASAEDPSRSSPLTALEALLRSETLTHPTVA